MKLSKFNIFVGWLLVVNCILSGIHHNFDEIMGWICALMFWSALQYSDRTLQIYKKIQELKNL
jgi:hypothetical protein